MKPEAPCRYGCRDPLACPYTHPDCHHCARVRREAATLAVQCGEKSCRHPQTFHGPGGCGGAIEVGWTTVRPLIWEYVERPVNTPGHSNKEARCGCPEWTTALVPSIAAPPVETVGGVDITPHDGAMLRRPKPRRSPGDSPLNVLAAIEDRLDSLEANVADHEQALGRLGAYGEAERIMAVVDATPTPAPKWDPETCYLVSAFAPDGVTNGPHDWSPPAEPTGSQTCETCHVVRTPLAGLDSFPVNAGDRLGLDLSTGADATAYIIRGTVVETGGGEVRVLVDRGTVAYPDMEARVILTHEPERATETPAEAEPGAMTTMDFPGAVLGILARTHEDPVVRMLAAAGTAGHAAAVLARSEALYLARRWADLDRLPPMADRDTWRSVSFDLLPGHVRHRSPGISRPVPPGAEGTG